MLYLALTSEDFHLPATNLTRELLYEKAEGHVFPWEGEEVVLMGYVRVIRRYILSLFYSIIDMEMLCILWV